MQQEEGTVKPGGGEGEGVRKGEEGEREKGGGGGRSGVPDCYAVIMIIGAYISGHVRKRPPCIKQQGKF